MAWHTDLMCDIEFNRETFNTINEVYNKIDEIESYIKTTKNTLRNLVVMTEPQKFCPEDYDPLSWASGECEESLDLLEEYAIELYKLRLLLNNWDACHTKDGLAIDFPEGIRYDSAFLQGDFVNTVKYPNRHE